MCPIMKSESWTVCPKKDASKDSKLGIEFAWLNVHSDTFPLSIVEWTLSQLASYHWSDQWPLNVDMQTHNVLQMSTCSGSTRCIAQTHVVQLLWFSIVAGQPHSNGARGFLPWVLLIPLQQCFFHRLHVLCFMGVCFATAGSISKHQGYQVMHSQLLSRMLAKAIYSEAVHVYS